jgi:hypothetical protein
MKMPAERQIPQRHRLAVTWVGFAPARLALRETSFCAACGKLSLHSAEAARGYIALLIRSGKHTPRRDDYTFAPYPCPEQQGKWHVGHNREAMELLKGAAKLRTKRESRQSASSRPGPRAASST